MYHFSGVDRASFIGLLAQEGAAAMVNAQVATQPAIMSAYKRWPEVPMVLDSSAFQGTTDVQWYASVVRAVGDRFIWCANLDVIGDQNGSDRNWKTLTELGADPLWVYQIQGGRDLDYMLSVAEVQRFIGVGGLVPLLKDSASQAVDLIGEVGHKLSQCEASAHFFGVGSPLVLAEFSHEPWFRSADSQSWLCGYKALELIARDGRRIRCSEAGIELTREECAAQNIRQIHGWMNGEPMQLALL